MMLTVNIYIYEFRSRLIGRLYVRGYSGLLAQVAQNTSTRTDGTVQLSHGLLL